MTTAERSAIMKALLADYVAIIMARARWLRSPPPVAKEPGVVWLG